MRTCAPTVIILLILARSGALSGADYRCRAGADPPSVYQGGTLRVASLNIGQGRGTSLNQILIGRHRIEENLEFSGYRVFDDDVSDHRLLVADVHWRDRP